VDPSPLKPSCQQRRRIDIQYVADLDQPEHSEVPCAVFVRQQGALTDPGGQLLHQLST